MKGSKIIRKTISKITVSTKSQETARKLFTHRLRKGHSGLIDETQPCRSSRQNEPEHEHPEIPDVIRKPASYHDFIDMPVYEPTMEEFSEPFLLVKNLNKKGFAESGCVKIKPPTGWNPEFSFNPKNRKLTTREQVLKNLSQGKSFLQNSNAYTLDEFQHAADTFAKNYNHKAPFDFKDTYRANEYEYWAMVEDPLFQKDNVVVEYAADLPSTKYGSGFPTTHRGRMTDDLNSEDDKTHPFNLNNMSRAKDSLFQIITTKQESISGISSSWMYSGMLFASFCWHVEDLYMYSINYMHKGAPKTWYCVPSKYKQEFDELIKEKFGLLFIKEPNLLYNIILTMNPLELIKRKIPVYRTEQQPGEFILTFPKVYHAGFSHGFNVSEAVNLAVPEWIPCAKQATQDYARDGFFKKCPFPYEWIILENIRKINQLNFSEETKIQLMNEYESIKLKELQDREAIHQCYSKVVVKPFDNHNQRYDSYTCSTCNNYTFLSYISCMGCKKACCTNHITICGCLNSKIILNVRFTDKELSESVLPVEEEW